MIRRITLSLTMTLAAVAAGQHYSGGHWLASFATYLVTGAALPLR